MRERIVKEGRRKELDIGFDGWSAQPPATRNCPEPMSTTAQSMRRSHPEPTARRRLARWRHQPRPPSWMGFQPDGCRGAPWHTPRWHDAPHCEAVVSAIVAWEEGGNVQQQALLAMELVEEGAARSQLTLTLEHDAREKGFAVSAFEARSRFDRCTDSRLPRCNSCTPTTSVGRLCIEHAPSSKIVLCGIFSPTTMTMSDDDRAGELTRPARSPSASAIYPGDREVTARRVW